MKAIQKIVKNGNSAQVTVPRQMLFALDLRLGDFVEIAITPEGELHIRPWRNPENVAHHSPGIIAPAAPAVPR